MARAWSAVPAAVLIVGIAVVTGACEDDPILFENACPKVAHAGPAWWVEGDLHFGVWIVDLEEDPVDLLIVRADGEEILDVEGHGAVGLTSAGQYPGQPHELVIAGKAVGGSKELRLQPEDLAGCEGPEVTLEVPKATE